MDDENSLHEKEPNLNEEEKIKQENLLLQSKIILKGGIFSETGNLPPEIENQFLKNILAFENAERKPVAEIIGVKQADFPTEESLSDSEVSRKLNEILMFFKKHEITLDLNKNIPDRVIYKFLTEEYLFDNAEAYPEGIGGLFIDGCSGDCPSCFQIEYCSSKDDIWPPDELAAEIKRRREEDF